MLFIGVILKLFTRKIKAFLGQNMGKTFCEITILTQSILLILHMSKQSLTLPLLRECQALSNIFRPLMLLPVASDT